MKRGVPSAAGASLDYADISSAIEKRLFIGKVPPGTTEDELRGAFMNFGPITECRVVPDRNGANNGIGFIGYDTWGAAHRALLECDGKVQLRGHLGTPAAIVVSFAERTNVVGRGGGLAYAKGLEIARVFVGSLPEDAADAELIQIFGACGHVTGASLLPAKSRSRCAFVNFEVWGEAFDAVERLAGQPLREGGEPMTVVLAQPREGASARGPERGREVGRGGERFGDRYGDRDRYSDRDRGDRYGDRYSDRHGDRYSDRYDRHEPDAKRRHMDGRGGGGPDLTVLLAAYSAAVNSDSPRAACDILHEQLMQARDGSTSHRGPSRSTSMPAGGHGGSSGGKFQVLGTASLAMGGGGGGVSHGGGGGGGARSDTARLFVGGLPHDCVDDDLASLANQLTFDLPPQSCQILECRVLPGKGCGYLRYASWEAAEEAYAALQGRQVEGWTSVLRVQWATPKGSEGPAQGGGRPDASSIAAIMQHPQGPMDPICFATLAEVEAQGCEPTRLFVGQIARDAVDAGNVLKPAFESFGHLVEWRWVQEKGVLYAAYGSFQEAQAAMQGLCSRVIPGISKCLNVKFSMRRGF